MFFRSHGNVINAQVVKLRAEKISKRVMRDAKRRIKRGEFVDSKAFQLHLGTIDSQYDQLMVDARIATTVQDYVSVRAARIAETGQLLAFYDASFDELRGLYKSLVDRARESGRMESLKDDISKPPDMGDLKAALKKLITDPLDPSEQELEKQALKARF